MFTLEKKKNKETGVKLDDLAFYFDSQEKNRLDLGAIGRRTGQVMALREKLLSLPEGEFEAAIKTIEKLVTTGPRQTSTLENKHRSETQRQAKMLYERVESANTATGAGSSNERVQKV